MADFKLSGILELTGVAGIPKVTSDIRQQLGNLPLQPLQQYNQQLLSANDNQNKLNKTTQASANITNKNTRAIRQSATAIEDFGDKAGLALRRFGAFTIAATGIFGTFRALRTGIGDAIAFERELVKVAQVTDRSLASLSGLRQEISTLGGEFGTNAGELATVSKTLSQAGLSAKDTQVALRTLAQTTLAPTFTDINKTTEGAIAAFRQFNLEAEDLQNTFGTINAVAGQFAVESDDIVTAIRKAGGAFSSASRGIVSGNDAIAEFIALFTSVRATTRESADTIGTGLRTIFTRLQRPETIDFLRQFGIELTDLEGRFVGPFQAIQRLGEGLRDLDTRDVRFASIVEQIGGFRQVSRVIPLLQQTALQQEVLNVGLRGQASLANDATQAQQTLAIQIAQTREELSALFRDISDTDSFKTLVTLSLELARSLIRLADAGKELIPILGAIGAARGLGAIVRALPAFTGRAISGSASVSLRRQVGGIVPGSGNGDKIQALLEPGEFVLNKKAVAEIGAGNLDRLNKKIPRFQSGGFVGGGFNFSNFSRNEEFRQTIPRLSDQLIEIGFSAEQVSDILNRIADQVKGPGEAIQKTLKFVDTELKKFNRNLVNTTRQQNRGGLLRFENEVRNARTFNTNTRGLTPSTRQFLAFPTQSISTTDFGSLSPTINRRTSFESELNNRRLLNLRNRVAGGFRDFPNRTIDNDRFFSSFISDGFIPGPNAISNDFSDIQRKRFGVSQTVSLNRRDVERRSQARQRARNIASIRRSRQLREFANTRGRVALLAGGIGASLLPQESLASRTAQGAAFTGLGASFLGAGPIGVAAAATIGGINSFLGGRQNDRETAAINELSRATDQLIQKFRELGFSTEDLREEEIQLANINNRLRVLRDAQSGRSSPTSSLLGFSSAGLGLTSDQNVNSRIAQARGGLSFFGSRIVSGLVNPLGLVSRDNSINNAIQGSIAVEDARALRVLDRAEAQERADASTDIAAASRSRITRFLQQGGNISDIDRQLLIASQSDNAQIQGGTSLNAQILGEQFAEDVLNNINATRRETQARQDIENALLRFKSNFDDINNRIEQSNAILSFTSQSGNIRSQNAIAAVNNDALSFQTASVFDSANIAAFSEGQLANFASRLNRNIGGGLNRNIVRSAIDLNSFRNQINNIESLGDTATDDQRQELERLKIQADSAEKAAQALSNLEQAVNNNVKLLQNELSVRRNLIRQSLGLDTQRSNIASNLSEQRSILFGGRGLNRRGIALNQQVTELAGITDPRQIASQITEIEAARQRNANSSADALTKAVRDSRLVEALDRNKTALNLLATNVSALTDIQNKLSEIQRQREAGAGLIQDNFGLGLQEQQRRARALTAFSIFQRTGGDLNALAQTGLTPEQVREGFRLRQQFQLDPEQSEREAVQFRRNILRSQGIRNQEDLNRRFGPEAGQALRPALELRGRAPREQELLQQFDNIAQRQLQALTAQKQLVDRTIADFNKEILNNLGNNIKGLKEAALALNQKITVEFQPVNVQVGLSNEFNNFSTNFKNEILNQVADEVRIALRNEREGAE